MKLKIAILFFVSIIGCKSESIQSSNCNLRLSDDVKKNWILSADSIYHIMNDSLFLRMDTIYKSCLMNLSSINIHDLFGIPNAIIKNSKGEQYKYFITPPCNKTIYNCGYLLFQFNSTNSLINYYVLYQEPGFPK